MKLKGNWGIVDSEDVCAGAEYLVKKGGTGTPAIEEIDRIDRKERIDRIDKIDRMDRIGRIL